MELTNAWSEDGDWQVLAALLHNIFGQDFGKGIGIWIPLDDGRRQGVKGVLIEALAQLKGILAGHRAAVELLLDVTHVAVRKCCGDMDKGLEKVVKHIQNYKKNIGNFCI